MTPKEKAIQLCESMIHKFDEDYIIIVKYTNKRHCAKQCALIAVDELIMEIYNIDHQHRAIYNSETGYYSYSDSKELIFWKQVKEEIQKL